MEILRAEKALLATQKLTQSTKFIAIAIDPQSRQSGQIGLIALSSREEILLIDARNNQSLGEFIAEVQMPLVAWDAKEIHKAWVLSFGQGPDRWADILLSEILIAGGREWDLSLNGTAARHGFDAPADIAQGLAELSAHSQTLYHIVESQIAMIRKEELGHASKLEASAIAAIAEMELAGMPFDAKKWGLLSKDAEKEKAEKAGEIQALFASVLGGDLFGGGSVNLENDGELKEALKQAGHPLPNMRRATLVDLPPPFGPPIRRFRELLKLTSTYGESFLTHVAPDGRIHPTFEQIGASTGRMACHAPNLQAMVKDSPHRVCFHAPPGRMLVSADYSACELRILAEMSDDPVFREAFERGDDLHARVASEIFGVPVSKKENPELRDRAKAINFGLAYGMGAGGLARTTKTSTEEARGLLERYFKTFPKIRSYLDKAAKQARRQGYARTLAGRRLYFTSLESREDRAYAERVAKNMPIQGTSADMIKIALANIRLALRSAGLDAQIVNTVHDEIVVETLKAEAEATAKIVGDEMRKAGEALLRTIPVEVDVTISEVWEK
ncbi:hypothetical protein KAI87_02320 [Myxococcota bacterium]|nr:hypothetical protein [Myxococcota bacterium]